MRSPRVIIKALRESFSPSHRQLADYILANADEVPFLSVHELARVTGVSVASISRFARTLGFQSFKEFKTSLGKDVLPSLGSIYQAISSQDSDEAVIEKVFSGNIRSLEDTLRIVERRDLIRAAGMICGSSRIVLFGIGSSGNIAHDAALRLAQLDLQAEAYTDSYQILNQALRMKKGEVAIGISHSGRSVSTVEALRLASGNRATTIGISNYLKSPLHEASNLFFCTSFPESRVKVAALSSRVAQTCVIDALYLLVARRREDALIKAERLNAHTEKALRFPTE